MGESLKIAFRYFEKALLSFVLTGLFLFAASGAIAHAQNDAGAPQDAKDSLRAELKEVERQIAESNTNIDEARKQQKSLKQEIALLDQQVKKQKLQLRETDLILKEVEENIKDTGNEISGLEGTLEERKRLLDASLKKLNEYDRTSWASIFLMSDSLSGFLNQIRYLHAIQADIADFIANIDTIRMNLESQKSDLEDKKTDILRLRGLQSLQKTSLEQKQKQKSALLSQTKGQEKLYEATIKKSKKDIISIKQQLFVLESVGVSLSFEEAMERAKFAAEKTGIRPAFLIAVFKVESRLGTYVGGGSWRVDMKPKERSIFLQLTSKLGLDPDTMPVSKRPSYGWGGAMGAAQFIPSTWLAYADQVASLTGHNPASPWDIEDAFVASALKLVGNGAGNQAYKDEHKAAAMYLAGGNYKKKVAQAYANNVMDWADYYQSQVDALSGISAKNNSLSGS